MKQFNFLFKIEPFYNSKWENELPNLEDTKKHFIEFLDVYFELGNILHTNYSNSMINFELFLGKKGTFVNTMASDDYNELGKYYHELKNYYGMILNACRRKYDFWLNDILPEKYKSKPTKKR
jgi:hypothetical protein